MKKIIATILALCMILGLAGVANAEATTLTMWTFIGGPLLGFSRWLFEGRHGDDPASLRGCPFQQPEQ